MGFYKGFIPPWKERALGNSSSAREVEMTPEIPAESTQQHLLSLA